MDFTRIDEHERDPAATIGSVVGLQGWKLCHRRWGSEAAKDERHVAALEQLSEPDPAAGNGGKVEIWCVLTHANGAGEELLASVEVDLAVIGIDVIGVRRCH